MSTQNLQGKVALVTGGTSGIGRATAIALSRAGASVVIGARREDEGLSRSVAQEVAAAGIRVNTIAPGPIATPMLERATDGDPTLFTQSVPLARTGTPDEVAALVTFLASDAAAFVTGTSVRIDGGMMS